MCNRNKGTLFSTSGTDTMVTFTEEGILGTGRSPRCFCQDSLYLFVTMSNSSIFLPALSLLPEQIAAQDAKCFSDEKADMSRPISETRSSTTLVLKPDISFCNSSTLSYLNCCHHHLQVGVDTTASLDQLRECYVSHNCSMLV